MTLQSNRLLLRPWRDADRAPYAELALDPVAMQFLASPARPETPDGWIDRQIARMAQGEPAYLAVERRDTHEFVGAVGLTHTAYEAHFTPAIQVGWRLLRRHWGQGYATEAAGAALDYGFTALAAEEIVAVTVPANLLSQQVMQRLGMTRSAADDFDHPRLPEGDPLRRHVLYRITRARWLARQG